MVILFSWGVLMNEFIIGFKRAFDFKGRSTRKDYWMFALISLIISFVLNIVEMTLFGGAFILSGLYLLIILIPEISLSIRRLHDIGRTGWWNLLMLLPFGILVLIFFYIQPTNPNSKY